MKLHQPAELIQDANEALEMLKDGNRRYVSGELAEKSSYAADREILQDGQTPFAVILACADSRVAPEIYFDQKAGDIFVVRNGGNVCDTTALGSIEYAVEHLGTRLVVVCGHSKCGAVTAAVEGGDPPPHIKFITDQIQPAVAKGGDLDHVIHQNVVEMVKIIQDEEHVKATGATVVGAYYDIHSGVVSWM